MDFLWTSNWPGRKWNVILDQSFDLKKKASSERCFERTLLAENEWTQLMASCAGLVGWKQFMNQESIIPVFKA